MARRASFQTVPCRGARGGTMRRLPGGNDAHFCESEGFGQFLGHAQMAEMDGVEGAAEDADRSVRREA